MHIVQLRTRRDRIIMFVVKAKLSASHMKLYFVPFIELHYESMRIRHYSVYQTLDLST